MCYARKAFVRQAHLRSSCKCWPGDDHDRHRLQLQGYRDHRHRTSHTDFDSHRRAEGRTVNAHPEAVTPAGFRGLPADAVDVIVIGAGFAGIYAVRQLRDKGFNVVGLEAGLGVGGAWYWNRYPGCRTDSEAHYYCYSFDKELLTEWRWKERFPSQAEVLSYLERAAVKFDVLRLFRFGSRVVNGTWDDHRHLWTLELENGALLTACVVVSAMGILSAPFKPEVAGINDFKGKWYLAQQWPAEGVELAGKRVGIIGTGATGVQLTPPIAEEAAHLYVFQRTPHYVVAGQNRPIDDERRAEIARNYDEIWRAVKGHSFAMPFVSSGRKAAETSAAERDLAYEKGWKKGGLSFLFETFDDLMVDPVANETAAEFFRRKIRETVHDPVIAETLTPRDYPLGGKRLPAGHNYYETFNRDNVTLVDVKRDPIVEFTPTGIRTHGANYDLEIVVFATGYDAFTGAVTRANLHGRSGRSIADVWNDGPQTFLGMTVRDFPNFFMIGGPQSPFANNPPCTESQVEWITEAILHIRDSGANVMEPSLSAQQAWVEHVNTVASGTLLPLGEKVGSWFTGANIPGKKHVLQVYFGGAHLYAERIRAVTAGRFREFELDSAAET